LEISLGGYGLQSTNLIETRDSGSPEEKRAALAHLMLHWDLQISETVSRNLTISSRQIGHFRTGNIRGGAAYGARSDAHNALDGQDLVSICALVNGRTLNCTEDNELQLSQGDIFVWQNSGEHIFEVPDFTENFTIVMPQPVFEAFVKVPSYGLQWALHGNTPIGKLIFRYLSDLRDTLPEFDDSSAETAIEVLLGMLSRVLRTEGVLVQKTSRTTRYQRILRYIEDNIAANDLSPTDIAKKHDISVRYLNMLFSENNITVAAWIKERRLDQSLSDLKFPPNVKSISEISYKWHFSDSAHYTRSFKARYGVTPTAWRSQNVIELPD
jgi:AraC-like DNA-binding protein